jgi:hypothetical protein
MLALTLAAPSAHAQYRPRNRPLTFNQQAWRGATRVNPNPLIAPGVTLNQWAYNTAVMGRAYSYVPPYLLGYNPYPSVVSYGPLVTYPTYYPSMSYSYVPGVYNPYAYGYGLGGVNPYLPY